ncbi:S-methyl-5-thioribose-1-phosphate isomerase [Rossellomorea aquimaris]|uniref:S-methyl-5-thioribose-1-phosphate isomerase n=1 Tax=Rossellomorea aquimaris TaxID=189382 RepID=UPI001CD26994|nr:S-methyl-5-thioribose-1-phosphate isomerase [Rossellomorea aquimaris]MCA1056657.1 S-methyl-5-thioribose-1-phosphate isomerase [Rossellomorea aquimaris]
MTNTMSIPTSLQWKEDHLLILNQQKLPHIIEYLELRELSDFYDSIITLKVRGAPAIGITAAYGLALSSIQSDADDLPSFMEEFNVNKTYLYSSRPTAVNLGWALDAMERAVHKSTSVNEAKTILLHTAIELHSEDEVVCKQIGEHGLQLLRDKRNILTICNAGSIATSKYGTALAPFHLGSEKGKNFHVYACETRPVLQGSRLTTWELQQSGVEVTLIADSMAAHTIKEKNIEAVIVGADRIASNGDTANKIGTSMLAILCNYYNIPFYVAAPTSTFDLSVDSGDRIPIEERPPEELTEINGERMAPEGIDVYNPAFDVTSHELITAIITENGVLYPDFKESITGLFTFANSKH